MFIFLDIFVIHFVLDRPLSIFQADKILLKKVTTFNFAAFIELKQAVNPKFPSVMTCSGSVAVFFLLEEMC